MIPTNQLKQNPLFLANTQALFEVDQPLAYALRASDFDEYLLDEKNGNIYDKKREVFLYEDLKADLDEKKAELYPEFSLYKILFFYGFGNGSLLKEILPKHASICVFESNIELLALAFCLHDFTEELRSENLVIYNTHTTQTAQLEPYLRKYRLLLLTYTLFTHSAYYEKYFLKEIEDIQEKNANAIKHLVYMHGTDPNDAMIGVKQFCDNIKTMIDLPSLSELCTQRATKCDTAVLVSTGPSLIKQLPLLKSMEKKVVIIAADSAYAVLKKNDIRPDYVCCMERTQNVSKFFAPSFEDEKNTLFILSSLMHKDVLSCMKDRFFMLVNRPLPLAIALGLKAYNFLGSGLSVANMNFELALRLKFKRILLIGQDLAFGEGGRSHAKGHVVSEYVDSKSKHTCDLPAYGGKGVVKSTLFWQQFKYTFENFGLIAKKMGIKVANCTEGGARIMGFTEQSFKQALSEYPLKDKFAYSVPKHNKAHLEKKVKKRLISFIQECDLYRKNSAKLIDAINKCPYRLAPIKKLDAKLFSFRKRFSKPRVFMEILTPICLHHELKITKIQAKYTKNEEEECEKLALKAETTREWLVEINAMFLLLSRQFKATLATFS